MLAALAFKQKNNLNNHPELSWYLFYLLEWPSDPLTIWSDVEANKNGWSKQHMAPIQWRSLLLFKVIFWGRSPPHSPERTWDIHGRCQKNRFLQRATFVWQIWGAAIINYPQHLHSFRPSAFIKGVLGHNQLTCIGTIQMFIYCIPIPSLL